MKVLSYESARGCSLAPGQVLDFLEPGLYFIKGGNGQGKSTLLADLAYGKGERSYESAQERLLAATCPGSLVSYVAQTWEPPNITVGSFLRMGEGVIDEEALWECRCALGVHEVSDAARLGELSGGELQRLAICLGVSKPAPYLLLDEPSNHLDDGSTRALREILSRQAKVRCVVVSTHDPRLQMSAATLYQVEDGLIFRCNEEPGAAAGNVTRESDATARNVTRESDATVGSMARESDATVGRETRRSGTATEGASSRIGFEGSFCAFEKKELGQAKTYPSGLAARVKEKAAGLQTRGMAWLGRAVALVVMANLLLWCGLQLQSRYCQPEDVQPDVVYLSALLGGDYQELNEDYATEKGLSVSSETWQRNLTYGDLKDVSALDGVTSVYVENPARSAASGEMGRAVEELLSRENLQNLVEEGEYVPLDPSELNELLESSIETLTEEDLVASAVVLTDEGCEEQVLNALMQAYPACYLASQGFIETWASQMNRGLLLQLLAVMVIGAALGAALVLTARHGVAEEDRLRLSCQSRFFLQDLGGYRRYRAMGCLLDLLPGALCFGIGAIALPEHALSLFALTTVALLVMVVPSWVASRRLLRGVVV